MIINESLNQFKKIAVVGLGVSGISALRLLKFLDKDVYIINQGLPNTWPEICDSVDISKKVSQDNLGDSQSLLKEMDLIILSPGISKTIALFDQVQCPIWCEIELAYRFNDAPILGVTGTNGKTTVVSFLKECAKYDQGDFFVGGNIGVPFCDYIFERMNGERELAQGVILELSSFQLNLIDQFQCDVAALLNLTFSHGERYDSLKDYAYDKFELFKNMKNEGMAFLPEKLDIKNPYPIKNEYRINLSVDEMKSELSQYISLEELQIYGDHNISNTYFVYELWMAFSDNLEAFKEACRSFNGVEYRLQMLGHAKGKMFFNDAKSTNWESTTTAINGVKDLGPITLLLGGQLRGEGDLQLDKLSNYQSNIQKVIFFGESGKVLSENCHEFEFEYFENLDDVFKGGFEAGVVLFSPAFPSFDQYKNYIERGRHFTSLVTTYLEQRS